MDELTSSLTCNIEKIIKVIFLLPYHHHSPADVARIRKKARLTQEELAARLAVSVETINNWETNDREPGGPENRLLQLVKMEGDARGAALDRAMHSGRVRGILPKKGPPRLTPSAGAECNKGSET